MITKEINTKKYTLIGISYDTVADVEKMFLEFKREEVVDFKVVTTYPRFRVSEEYLAQVLELLSANFTDAVVNQIESND